MFDKELFLNNVFSLAEQKGLSIYALEDSIGVSAGYLAKLRKDDTRKNVTADLMLKLSDKLGISIDYLCKVKCDALNNDEMQIISFFEKIKKETLSNNYKWHKEDADFIEAGRGTIFSALSSYGEYGEAILYSSFKNKRSTAVGESFYTEIKEDVFLIIIQIEGEPSRARELESYIWRTGNKHFETSKLCATCKTQSSLLDLALQDLYKIAESSGNRITLDGKTSKFISEFLGDSVS